MNDNTRISRRDIIGKLTAVAAAIGAFAKLRARAQAAPTIDQATAQYVSHPVLGNQCSWCTQFVAPSSCQIVKGTISPRGHCKYFATKLP